VKHVYVEHGKELGLGLRKECTEPTEDVQIQPNNIEQYTPKKELFPESLKRVIRAMRQLENRKIEVRMKPVAFRCADSPRKFQLSSFALTSERQLLSCLYRFSDQVEIRLRQLVEQ
jgi:hypothetical protein